MQGTVFTLSSKETAMCAGMGEVWLNDLTARGAFVITNPEVRRGQSRKYHGAIEVPVICAVARVARGIPQLPTKVAAEMAVALRPVARKYFSDYLIKCRVGRTDSEFELERGINPRVGPSDEPAGPLSVLLVPNRGKFKAIPYGRLTDRPRAPAGEEGYQLNLETAWDELCKFTLAQKQ